MKEFIQQEKRRIQAALEKFNREGAYIAVYGEDRKYLFRDVLDSLTVTRVAPKFDAEGNHTGTDFWLLWKPVGYPEGFQYSHTAKIVHQHVDDALANGEWLVVDLTDDRGRRYHIEALLDITEPNELATWRDWQAYRKKNAERLAKIDAEILEEHLEIAEGWE